MASDVDIAGGRAALYRSLRRRNRVVGLLRVVVPLAGVVLLAVLGAQLFLTNLTKDFTVGRVSVARDRLQVDAPTYSGALGDGSLYTVTAARAEAALGAPNLIGLTDGQVMLTRSGGRQATATAAAAELDSEKQVIDVAGTTNFADDTGTKGTLIGMHIDFPAQTMNVGGAVHIAFGTGETIDAQSMTYDAAAKLWQFQGVTVVLPDTPGAMAQ